MPALYSVAQGIVFPGGCVSWGGEGAFSHILYKFSMGMCRPGFLPFYLYPRCSVNFQSQCFGMGYKQFLPFGLRWATTIDWGRDSLVQAKHPHS